MHHWEAGELPFWEFIFKMSIAHGRHGINYSSHVPIAPLHGAILVCLDR